MGAIVIAWHFIMAMLWRGLLVLTLPLALFGWLEPLAYAAFQVAYHDERTVF